MVFQFNSIVRFKYRFTYHTSINKMRYNYIPRLTGNLSVIARQ